MTTATTTITVGSVVITITAPSQEPPAPATLTTILERIETMSQALDDLTREVAETTTVVESAIVLIQGLRDQLAAAGTDPTKLAELAATLDAQQTALAAAIAAGTVAATEATPE